MLNEKIKYNSPKQNLEKAEEPLHTFDLILNNEIVGRAEITYYSKPFPLYQINDLYIEFEHQGKRYASEIMSQVESFLKKRRKAGVIVDAIDEDSPSSGMYERRGWSKVPNEDSLYAYNLPKSASIKDLRAYGTMQTDLMERKSWEKKNNSK